MPTGVYERPSPQERFWAQTDRRGEDECWPWLGRRDVNGYGYIGITKPSASLAHRVSHEWFIGLIPEGWQVDHLCRNTSCVNPRHLEAVTQRENLLRSDAPSGINKRKTHCIRGHEFTEENTYRHMKRGRPGRACRACAKEREQRRRVNAG